MGHHAQKLVIKGSLLTFTYALNSGLHIVINASIGHLQRMRMPEFCDPSADAATKQKLEDAFPNRTIVQINIDYIAAAGGGVHCTTQQQPA